MVGVNGACLVVFLFGLLGFEFHGSVRWCSCEGWFVRCTVECSYLCRFRLLVGGCFFVVFRVLGLVCWLDCCLIWVVLIYGVSCYSVVVGAVFYIIGFSCCVVCLGFCFCAQGRDVLFRVGCIKFVVLLWCVVMVVVYVLVLGG